MNTSSPKKNPSREVAALPATEPVVNAQAEAEKSAVMELKSTLVADPARRPLTSKTLLPGFVRDLLWCCPASGAGVHRWLFAAARGLHAHYADENQIITLLEVGSAGCGRPVERREIEEAVRNSRQNSGHPGHSASGTPPTMGWPRPDLTKIETITAAGVGLEELKKASPQRCKDEPNHAEELIDQLFPGDVLLCVGESLQHFATRPREQWSGKLAGQQFIVPSPMVSKSGRTKDGHLSSRSLENTGPRRFLVVEFDQGTPDQHAALLLYLAGLAPLALVVQSGGKSLHGWFYCAGQPEVELQKFMRYAVSLRADPATWTRSQFVRLPGGLRDNGKRQQVLFFNPAAIGGAK